MDQLLDIVPNHMGVSSDNALWYDVLENGRASAYASFFDINWSPANSEKPRGKVLLPILGDHFRAALERREIRLSYDAEVGTFSVNYYEHRCPIDPGTYPMILDSIPLPEADVHRQEIERLVTAFGNLPGRDTTDGECVASRARGAASLKADLAEVCARHPGIARSVEERVGWLNGEGLESLHALLEAQAYRLAYWRAASDEINYRPAFLRSQRPGRHPSRG